METKMTCSKCIAHVDGARAVIELCTLHAAASELLQAAKYTDEIVRIARRYFPKSVANSDRFQLENTCAAIGKAINKAESLI